MAKLRMMEMTAETLTKLLALAVDVCRELGLSNDEAHDIFQDVLIKRRGEEDGV